MRPFVAVFLLIITILFFENVSNVSAQFLEAVVAEFKKPIDAPDAKLKVLAGGEISIEELKGKVILLEFFDHHGPVSGISKKNIAEAEKIPSPAPILNSAG